MLLSQQLFNSWQLQRQRTIKAAIALAQDVTDSPPSTAKSAVRCKAVFTCTRQRQAMSIRRHCNATVEDFPQKRKKLGILLEPSHNMRPLSPVWIQGTRNSYSSCLTTPGSERPAITDTGRTAPHSGMLVHIFHAFVTRAKKVPSCGHMLAIHILIRHLRFHLLSHAEALWEGGVGRDHKPEPLVCGVVCKVEQQAGVTKLGGVVLLHNGVALVIVRLVKHEAVALVLDRHLDCTVKLGWEIGRRRLDLCCN